MKFICQCLTCIEQVEPIEEGGILLNALPSSHVLGFPLWLVAIVAKFISVHVVEFMPVKNTLEAIRSSETNVLVGVPMMYQFFASALSQGASLPRRIKAVISGGDKFSVALDEVLERYIGVRFWKVTA